MIESNEEKLLTPGEPRPLLSTHEFLKTTPDHELKNVFGIAGGNQPLQTPVTPIQKSVPPFLPPVFKNISGEAFASSPAHAAQNKTKPKRIVLKIFTTFFLFLLTGIMILYIWGGVVKN